MADVELLPCAECGMPCRAGEYHPFAACLMFKACHNSETVRANLAPLRAEIEALRAEVERLREIVRPKREEECLTLDHWRMRAYDLEANWARCSRACAIEQDKRELAEARAERLAEALRLIESAKDRGFGIDYARGVAQSALRDHDQEGHNG